jgi:hypothetical protein
MIEINSADKTEVIKRATVYLKQHLMQGDYGLSCFGADGTPRFSHNKGHLFSAFFIAEAIGPELTEVERALLLVRILSEENDGLWGYSPPGYLLGRKHNPFLVDADDTAFALRTCRILGIYRSPRCLLRFWNGHPPRCLKFMGRLWGESGFQTFASSGPKRFVDDPSVENNLQMHLDVNANVFAALKGTDLEPLIDWDLIVKSMRTDGFWPTYFYPSPNYPAYLIGNLLEGATEFEDTKGRAAGFLRNTQNSDGSWGDPGDPWETALALHAMASFGTDNRILTDGARYLMDSVTENGSWKSEKVIWRFYAANDDIWEARDSNAVVTTALVISALKALKNQGDEEFLVRG